MRTLLVAALVAAIVPAPAASAPPAPAALVVHIRDDAFVPASLTVKAGDKVTFVNDDDDAHTATADDASWDSEGLNQGQKWTHAFMKPGKIAYHCTVHPMMHGTIIVAAASRPSSAP
ncbi:MAG TPA: cupredoxin domain-containing protein [Candidatus Elarobacter sp.]|nr:cupredoxin domain-containing protein [Candidatus Elarobacter sp.]